MDWLTEHFDVLLPIALVLFFVFQRFFVQGEGEVPSSGAGDSEAEREARRIQEEIRRKIVARQQARAEETPGRGNEAFQGPDERRADAFSRGEPAPPPIRFDWGRATTTSSAPPPLEQRESARPTAPRRDMQDELRIQRERLKEARRTKADAVRRTSEAGLNRGGSAYLTPVQVEGGLRTHLLADLSTRHSLKRAFVLKEVVDRPIGLRIGADSYSNWV
jgi:hypothetical protein